MVVIAETYRPDRSFRPEQVFTHSPNPGRKSLLLAVRQLFQRRMSTLPPCGEGGGDPSSRYLPDEDAKAGVNLGVVTEDTEVDA